MFKENELKAEMARAEITAAEIAKATEMDPATFYRKLKNQGSFTREEISKIIDILHLNGEAVERIFFAR